MNAIKKIGKFAFSCALFVAAMLFIFSMLGGNDAPYKESIEEFLRQQSGGRDARVELLVNMRFFPDMLIDLRGAEIAGTDPGAEVAMRIENFRIRVGFFDALLKNKHIKDFYVRHMYAEKGLLTVGRLEIETVEILPASLSKNETTGIQSITPPYLVIIGTHNGQDISRKIELTPVGSGRSLRYAIKDMTTLDSLVALIQKDTPAKP